jgi:hypothetical protein
MRRIFELYKKDYSKLEFPNDTYYTYNEYQDLVPVIDKDNTVDVVLPNKYDIRARDYVIDNISKVANESFTKLQRTSNFSLSKFTENTEGVIVGQGLNASPIIKTFDSVFSTIIYKVESDEALRYEGNTMNSNYFKNSDTSTYIYDSKFINKNSNYQLEINSVINTDNNLFSSCKNSVGFIPLICDITNIDAQPASNGDLYSTSFSNTFTIKTVYEMTNDTYTFYVLNSNNTIRSFEANIEYHSTVGSYLNYLCYIPDDFSLIEGDKTLYYGDLSVRSSFSTTSENRTNYVINDLDYLNVYYDYETEIKGEMNSITSTLPSGIDIKDISINEHHGFYINKDNELVGIGVETKGEISSAPIDGYYIDVACGKYHNIAIKDSNEIVSWGNDDFGQVSNTPDGKFKRVYAGDFISCAISMNDELFIWGDTVHYTPVIDNIMTDIKDVAIGERFILCLKTDGTLFGIGDDTYGQISNIPNDKIKSISAGKYHCAAIGESGTLYTWGRNSENQLDGSDTTKSVLFVACTNYGGGYIDSNKRFTPFGEITQGATQLYDDIVAGSSNIVLLKSGNMIFEKYFKKFEVTGDRYDMRIDIDLIDVAITKIYSDIDILK